MLREPLLIHDADAEDDHDDDDSSHSAAAAAAAAAASSLSAFRRKHKNKKDALTSIKKTKNTTGEDGASVLASCSITRISSVVIPVLLRVKFLLAGFFFGSCSEHFIIHQQQQSLSLLALQHDHDHDDVPTTTTTTTLITNEDDDDDSSSSSFLSWLVWYEVSALCIDVLFVLYVVLLVRNIVVRRKESSSLRPPPQQQNQQDDDSTSGTTSTPGGRVMRPDMILTINALNWTVGMLLGTVATLSAVYGPSRILVGERLCQGLFIMVLGIVACFLTRELIAYFVDWWWSWWNFCPQNHHCYPTTTTTASSSSSSNDHEDIGTERGENDDDDDDAREAEPSFLLAHVV